MLRRRSLLLLLGALSLPSAVSSAARAVPDRLPGLGGTERRVPVDVREPPWSSLVRVNVPGSARCTGFLASPTIVVLAAHCLFLRRAGHFAPPGSIHVLRGYASGIYAGHAVAAEYRVAPGFDAVDPGRSQGSDAAVLRLAAPFGTGLPLAGDPGEASLPGTAVTLGGYGQDRGERLLADPSCAVTGFGRDAAGHAVLVHDCAGTYGESGSPLLAQGPEGWRVLGIAVGGFGNRAGGIAVPASALRALLSQQ